MEQTKEELWSVAAEYYKLKSEGKKPIAHYYCGDEDLWIEHNDYGGSDIPDFINGDIWRLKPETVQHKGGEYPKPCTDVDQILKADFVYTPGFETTDNGLFPVAHRVSISGVCAGISAANSGLYYLDGMAAIERAKVIYEID